MEDLKFKIDGGKWENLKDYNDYDILFLDCEKIQIKDKTKIDLTKLNSADKVRLFLLDQKQNKQYLKRYRNYYNYYNTFKQEELKNLKLFNISKSTKLKDMLTLNFNSAFTCYNSNCNNFLRCYSKKIERFRPSVLKMIARQAVIFNKLPPSVLTEKMKQEVINHFKHNPEAPREVRLCQYGSINQQQFNQLLKVIDKLYYFLVDVNLSFYIYLDDFKQVPEEYRYLINSIFFINSSNIKTYNRFKQDKTQTNKIISMDKIFFDELKNQEQENYNFCYGNCTTCNYCKTAQEKPIIFKNH